MILSFIKMDILMKFNKFFSILLINFFLFCFGFGFNGFFIEGAFQRYIAVSGLEEYTIPKPGWRGCLGYDFFHNKPHSFQISLKTGHSVVAGSNPIVRTLDITPISLGIAYSFTPPPCT